MIDSNFDLSTHTIQRYLVGCGLIRADEDIEVQELGGGVSNTVILVTFPGDVRKRWVAKQSLGKLRVKDDWRSDRARIFKEAECMRALSDLLGKGAAPEVIWEDRANFLLVMTAAPEGSRVWKDLLLAGQVDASLADQAGMLLASVIAGSQHHAGLRQAFEAREVFDQLRIDPYYRTVAARCPDVAPAIQRLIADSWSIRTSLTHGDYSPKNMLAHHSKIFLIDFEVAHWGDPAFDAAFLLNHLLLKGFYRSQQWARYAGAARQFWGSLNRHLQAILEEDLEAMTSRHLGALMLARIDGKSPVEYLTEEPVKNAVRRAAKRILLDQPLTIEDAIEIAGDENAAPN